MGLLFMLDVLCGSKTVQKILIYLFVNGKGYGAEIQRQLSTPLTPVQKGLQRLEKGGIILSYYEGKTKLFQLNPAFPLMPELDALLKKSFTLLPPQEKKLYHAAVHTNTKIAQLENLDVLLCFWQKLKQVKHLAFKAKSNNKAEGGWNGKGTGEVHTTLDNDNTLIFHERGRWHTADQREFEFSNTFRWSIDRQRQMISLEHLRRGPNLPVFLFHLIPSGNHSLTSVDSHLCGGDVYFGQISCNTQRLRLHWRVIGPQKNEELDYYYS